MLLVTARGPIGPRVIRQDLAVARAFAERQEGRPWWYVVDPTDVLPSPLNVQFLRAVRRLPSVAGYFVVARRQPMRAASEVLVRLGGPHRVFRSVDEALAEVRAASERPRTP